MANKQNLLGNWFRWWRQRRRCVTMSNKQNLLGNVGSYKSDLSLDGVTPKTDVAEVRFLATLADAPEGAADLSDAQDGSVRCWTEGRVQYIAGEGGVVGGSSCEYPFAKYENVTAIRFNGNFDTSHVENMGSMFRDCHSLKTLNLSGWDTSQVEGMEGMFADCHSLTELNLSGWDTSNVTSMMEMFGGCYSLKTLYLSGWDTSNVRNMSHMFEFCHSLKDLDLSGWNTSNVKAMYDMFPCCFSLTTLNLSGWDTTNVRGMEDMFQRCESLETLDLSGWTISDKTDVRSLFRSIDRKSLMALNLSGWDVSRVEKIKEILPLCSVLTDFDPDWLDTRRARTKDMYKGTRWE